MAPFLKLVPNLLSLSRILLLIPLIYFIRSNAITQIIVFCILMIASDYLDGFLARKWRTVTATGRILDPLADKICISSVGVALVLFREFPLMLLIALLLRDLIILSGSIFIIKKTNDIPSSNYTGKIAVGVMSLCMLVFLLDIEILKLPIIIAVALMIPISLWSYGLRLYKTL